MCSVLLVTCKCLRLSDHPRALLGNANGDVTDDLKTPSGVVIDSNSSPKELHEEFAMTCEYLVGDINDTYNSI